MAEMKKPGAGILISMLITFAVIIGFVAMTSFPQTSKLVNDPKTAGYFIFAIIAASLLPFFVAFGPMVKNMINTSKQKKRLLQVGQRKQVPVVNVQDTGITVNNNPYIQVTVEINGIKAHFQTVVSRIGIPRPGDMMEVLYDPSDPTIVIPAP